MTPRNVPPAPGWSADGHRIKVPLLYDRGRDTVWVYGALRVRDGQTLTQIAPARTTAGDLALLQALDQAHPHGDRDLLTDTLSSHTSGPILEWLVAHPRIQHAVIPVGASWLNLIEGWWRICCRTAFAGVSLANAEDVAYATRIATVHLTRHARPWIWGRPAPPRRTLRRCCVYRL